MFSKKTLLPLLASITVLSVGCSEYLNGHKEEPKVIELSDKQFACLKDVPDQLMKFSVGEATPAEIRMGFDCMGSSLTFFNKKTYGSRADAYTAEEIRRFFAKYFLKKNNVTPEFASELMKIKQALLGGSESHITKEELRRLVDMFTVMREEAVLLTPHMRTLLDQDEKKKANWEEVSAAISQLRRSAQKLLKNTQFAKSDYSFEDAKGALKGFAAFIKGNETFAPYEMYSQWVPMVESVKTILMGKKARFAGYDQWSDSLNTVLDLYELALKYYYTIGDFKFENTQKVHQVSQFIDQGLTLILNSHQMKTTGVIPKEDIDKLIDIVLPKLTKEITPFALKKSYKVVLNKILDPERKADNRSLHGLERKHLATLLREFNVWRLTQIFFEYVTNHEGDGLSQMQLIAAYEKFDSRAVIRSMLTDDAFEQRALENSWSDLGDLLRNPVMLTFNEQGRMMVAPGTSIMKQSWAGLTKFNLMKAVSRMLLLGYADNVAGKMSQAGLSQAALVAWYDDFLELGLDLKAFDPRSANSGARSFLEANFFTFSGNGDDHMDQKESFEFVSTLFSAGLATSNSISKHMKLAKCGSPLTDVFGQPFFDEGCFKSQLRHHFRYYFDNMPNMVTYVRQLNEAQWNQFYSYLAAASVTPDQKVGWVETANVRTMVTILHYIEAVMVIYDKDRSQGLSLDEVYDSAPRFMSFLKTVSPVGWEYVVKQGFAHLVFKGTIPGAGGLIGFQLDKMWGLEEAQRMEIARLFGTLKDQLNKVEN